LHRPAINKHRARRPEHAAAARRRTVALVARVIGHLAMGVPLTVADHRRAGGFEWRQRVADGEPMEKIAKRPMLTAGVCSQ
jgi:hypothetical protein